MGLQQSKDELLYQQVNYGNIEGIKSLRREGAGLEWIDRERKTPLIAACMNPELYNVAKTLIELGANVNAYRPGRYAGTPLHHAAKSGLDQSVKLLLSNGANALVMNDDCQTPLDVARANGYNNVVRAIEDHVCLFSGWLLELHGPGFLNLLAPQLLSRKVWVVILPCGSRNIRKPLKLELAIYTGVQDAKPRTIVPLWKSKLDEPNFYLPDPAAIISVVSRIPRRWRRRRAISSSQEARRARIKLSPVSEAEREQLRRFCNAYKGTPQVIHQSLPFPVPTVPANIIPVRQNEDPATAISASSSSCSTDSSSIHDKNLQTDGASSSHKSNATKCEVEEAGPSIITTQAVQNVVTSRVNSILDSSLPPPSAPAASDASLDISPVHYPSIDISPLETTHSDDAHENKEGDASCCTICLDAPVEGACVPCGHLAGCMSCLNEVKEKKWGCPVCRTKIDQVVRIYSV